MAKAIGLCDSSIVPHPLPLFAALAENDVDERRDNHQNRTSDCHRGGIGTKQDGTNPEERDDEKNHTPTSSQSQ